MPVAGPGRIGAELAPVRFRRHVGEYLPTDRGGRIAGELAPIAAAERVMFEAGKSGAIVTGRQAPGPCRQHLAGGHPSIGYARAESLDRGIDPRGVPRSGGYPVRGTGQIEGRGTPFGRPLLRPGHYLTFCTHRPTGSAAVGDLRSSYTHRFGAATVAICLADFVEGPLNIDEHGWRGRNPQRLPAPEEHHRVLLDHGGQTGGRSAHLASTSLGCDVVVAGWGWAHLGSRCPDRGMSRSGPRASAFPNPQAHRLRAATAGAGLADLPGCAHLLSGA